MNYLRPFVLLVLFCLLACDIPVQRFANLDGVMIIFGARSGTVVYIPAEGKAWDVGWEKKMGEPNFICGGKGDTLFIAVDSFDRSKSDFLKLVYQYEPTSGNYRKVDILSEPISKCYGLDFDRISRTYLFAGYYQGKQGLFLLDSLFQLKGNLMDSCPCARTQYEEHPYRNAIRLANGKVLFECDTDTYISDSKPLLIPRESAVLSVSHDRRKILYTLGWKKEMSVFVYDVDKDITKELNIENKVIYDGGFSPDGNFLALIEQTYNLGNAVKLHLYNLSTDSLTYSGVYVDGVPFWGNFSGELKSLLPYTP